MSGDCGNVKKKRGERCRPPRVRMLVFVYFTITMRFTSTPFGATRR